MDVDTLLRKIYSRDSIVEDDAAPIVSMMEQDDALTIGTVGLWKGQLGETKVGVLLDSDTLQLYKKHDMVWCQVDYQLILSHGR